MKPPSELEQLSAAVPVPHDVRKAIAYIRTSLQDTICLGDITQHCGVAERTLNRHFRIFLNCSPMEYLRRLRLAAARELLLTGIPTLTVTEVSNKFNFNHFGRFADYYRRYYGEAPAITLQKARLLAASATMAKGRRSTLCEGPTIHKKKPPLVYRERPTIAILPCLTCPTETTLGWIAENLAASIAANLAAVRSLSILMPNPRQVCSRDPQKVAREFSARYFLTGHITNSGRNLRVILSLRNSSDGEHVWGDSFDGDLDRPIELQDHIISHLIRVILASVRGKEIDYSLRTPPENLDAYGLSMRALPFVFASEPDSARRGLDLLNRAIEMDPDYGLATALAAWCHAQLVMYNGTSTPAEETQSALDLVRRAAILDDEDPLALAAQCAVFIMAREFDIAGALISRSLARDPSCGWAWGRSGWLNAYKGDPEKAIEHFRHALFFDINNAVRANALVGISSAHFDAGRYDAAAHFSQEAMLHQPGAVWANRSLAVSYAHLGEHSKALESLNKLRRYSPDLTVSQVVSAIPFNPEFLDRLANGLDDLGLPS
jgi:TolB-like protein/tetratricopeptide (TPR) repeat protein